MLAGAGVTRCTLSDGRSVDIPWRAGDAFAPPINATCVHTATQGPARLASFNDLRYLMGLYRNEAFLFANSAPFAKRQAQALAAGLSAPARDMALAQGDGAAHDVEAAELQGRAVHGLDVHLARALAFVKANPRICPARTLIIYAWNEHDEGGWLCPTWTPSGQADDSRVQAIRKVLRP